MVTVRKKPVVVEATRFTEDMILDESYPDFVRLGNLSISAPDKNGKREITSYKFYIETLEGDMEIKIGDWLITGVNGEHYPCKPDIFAKTYEILEVEDEQRTTTG